MTVDQRMFQQNPSRTLSVSIDGIADAALRARAALPEEASLVCDACDVSIEGEPGGRGLYVWHRGEELRFEEPALCEACATAIGVTALGGWAVEEEEG